MTDANTRRDLRGMLQQDRRRAEAGCGSGHADTCDGRHDTASGVMPSSPRVFASANSSTQKRAGMPRTRQRDTMPTEHPVASATEALPPKASMVCDAFMPHRMAIMDIDARPKRPWLKKACGGSLPGMAKVTDMLGTALKAQIAARLTAARKAYHPNAAEVARALGVSPTTWDKYEKGSRYPNERLVVMFCDMTGCPTDFIYRGLITGDMHPAMAARIGMLYPELVEQAAEAAKASRSRLAAGL